MMVRSEITTLTSTSSRSSSMMGRTTVRMLICRFIGWLRFGGRGEFEQRALLPGGGEVDVESGDHWSFER